MERAFYQKLLRWKESNLRKPLVVRGARQVGKTYILTKFAKQEYEDHVYINFDETPHLASFFSEDLDPERIIKELNIYFKKKIHPGSTLIVLDEIQECPQALACLKYFCEKKSEYHVATAGSLLGVKLTNGFPVGKVNFLDLAPLNFFEFLTAIGEQGLVAMLEEMDRPKPISEVFHNKLTSLLKYYFIIGGMPEAIAAYLETESLEQVRVVQKEILDAYILDFAKHAPKDEVMKIMSIWESIPGQLAKENKKFIFSAIHTSARAREFKTSLQWLKSAGLVVTAHHISTPKLPLARISHAHEKDGRTPFGQIFDVAKSQYPQDIGDERSRKDDRTDVDDLSRGCEKCGLDAYADKQAFKVFLLDVGLLGTMSKLDPRIILEGNQLFQEFKGALAENFAATELHDKYFDELYYWTSQGIAEVDFILSTEQHIFPLEVKAGFSKKKKSLSVYDEKFSKEDNAPLVLSRASLRNFTLDGKLVNYPLYAISLFPRFRLNTG